MRRLTFGDWLRLSGLGILFYSVTQGAQYLGLRMLPAVTVSLMLNFTAFIVAGLGILFLNERPSSIQWSGLLFFGLGIPVYFFPLDLQAGNWVGIGIVAMGVLANAFSAVFSRSVNRSGQIPPLVVTAISMGIGSVLLLSTGLLTEGLPGLSVSDWGIVLWLAVIHTALAFTLWNHTLRTLSAMESSMINGSMLVQIAVLAWVFLGEGLTWKSGLGLAAAAAGAVLVQLRGLVKRTQVRHPGGPDPQVDPTEREDEMKELLRSSNR